MSLAKMVVNNCKNYDKYLNEVGRNRQAAMLRSLDDIFAKAPPGSVKLAAGFLHHDMFPFESISVTTKDGYSFCLEGDELAEATQYQVTSGFPPLRKLMKEMVREVHKPPYDAETILVTGNQDGLAKVLEMTLEPGRPVFVADPTYACAIDMMLPYNPTYYPIPEDVDGLIPELFKEALVKNQIASGGDPRKMGNVLYIVPNGSNPSGTVITTERKKQIYKLACEYDILILEDDAYFIYNFQEEEQISFLSLDTEQRVIRLEGLSKLMVPGLRISSATGPAPLIEKLEWHMQVTVGHVASLPSVIIYKVLSHWGTEGYTKQVQKVRKFYRQRMQTCLASANKYLKGLAKFNAPKSSLYLWLEVIGVEDIFTMVMEKVLAKGVMVVPGHFFFTPRGDGGLPKNCIRISYSTIDSDKIDKVFKVLAEAIREEQKLQSKAIVK